jgi:phage tail-like protein
MTSVGQLVVQLQGSVVNTLALQPGVLTIGRTPENDLPLNLPLVSKRHAELNITEQGVLVTDLGSQYGTFVAGNKLIPNQPYPLIKGALLQIGPFKITFRDAINQSAEELPISEDAKELEFEVVQTHDISPRQKHPTPFVLSDQAMYTQDLPVIFQENDFMNRFMKIFETVWEPLEWRTDAIEFYFDPRTAPSELLEWLGGWLSIQVYSRMPERRKRELVSEAMTLYHWRGTKYGLERMIELCTGLIPEIHEDPKEAFVFWVKLTSTPEALTLDLMRDLIETHKPAHTLFKFDLQ